MSSPISINGKADALADEVSHSLSVSPTATFMSTSPLQSYTSNAIKSKQSRYASEKQLKPFATEDIKILLLENVNKSGKDLLAAQGYQVEALKTSLPEDQLIEKIR